MTPIFRRDPIPMTGKRKRHRRRCGRSPSCPCCPPTRRGEWGEWLRDLWRDWTKDDERREKWDE